MEAKVALVTGGTGGIGTHICQQFADCGLKVAAGYNNGGHGEKAYAWQHAQKELGYEFQVFYGDISNFESSQAMIQAIEASMGPVEILVNNAGITQDVTLKKMTSEQWLSVLRTNLDSLFNVTRQVIPNMIAKGFGRIVNISSINGQKGQVGQTNYSAAKSGIYGFTKALAQEVAKNGITVNTVSPGYVATQMVQKMPQTVLEKIVAQIPIGRLGRPEEIGALVNFLVSPQAGFITGANFAINGGQHMY